MLIAMQGCNSATPLGNLAPTRSNQAVGASVPRVKCVAARCTRARVRTEVASVEVQAA